MLLKGYRKEVVRPECRPEAQSVQCIAHLDEDITEVIPYLNAVLGGFQYLKDPPSVSFKVHGKLIAVHPRMICVNALLDVSEGDKIIEWLKQEINDTWERRSEIEPRFEGAPKPKVIEILKLSAENQLPGMRPTYVHGLRHPGGRWWARSGGLSSLERRRQGKARGLSQTVSS